MPTLRFDHGLQEEADGLIDHLAAAQAEVVSELVEDLASAVGKGRFDA